MEARVLCTSRVHAWFLVFLPVCVRAYGSNRAATRSSGGGALVMTGEGGNAWLSHDVVCVLSCFNSLTVSVLCVNSMTLNLLHVYVLFLTTCTHEESGGLATSCMHHTRFHIYLRNNEPRIRTSQRGA